ncbi:MAG: DUF2278 family protein, partial [Actinomycetota bacterium]|nr:DUF2278 family protein [Actinomycetota bacterium]
MALSGYGVLVAQAQDRRREGEAQTPHFQVRLGDEAGTSYRIAVNVQSQQSPPDLLYLIDDDLRHPVTTALDALASGWHPLPPRPDGPNLDFIRANLFDRARMRVLPAEVAGPDNDLADLLDHYVQRAIGDPTARVYAFGQRWGPEQGTPDKVFGFEPGNGVHDIHMNQGSSGRFRRDNGVWQDGGLLVRFPGESRWVAIFLAFQSQAWHTDDTTGDPIGDGVPPPEAQTAAVRIVAAMVNPIGPAPEAETVLLLNASPAPVDLTGWRIADRAKNSCSVPGGPLAPGETLRVPIAEGVTLGNRGGAITLLDGGGLKVGGVAYT